MIGAEWTVFVLQVHALGMPPAERREDSMLALQGLNIFGGTELKVQP